MIRQPDLIRYPQSDQDMEFKKESLNPFSPSLVPVTRNLAVAGTSMHVIPRNPLFAKTIWTTPRTVASAEHQLTFS